MRRWLAAAAVIALALVATPASSANGVRAVGWWTRSPLASAPDGGVAVASAPDGAVSLAALRIDLGSTSPDAVRVELTEAGGVGADLAVLQLCPAPDDWVPVAGGSFADAPAANCGASAPLTREGTTWTADAMDLLAGRRGTVTLMVVPGAGPGGFSAFDLSFLPPTAEVTTAAGAPVVERPTESSDAPAVPPFESTDVAPFPAVPDAPGAPAVGAPARDLAPVETGPDAGAAQAPLVPVARSLTGSDVGPDWGAAAGYVVLSALVGVAAGVARWRLTPLLRRQVAGGG